MRVMIDTNILVSVLLFPSQQMNTLIYKITTEHQLVLSSYVVDELLNVVRRKFKDKLEAADLLLSQLPYELVYTPEHMKPELFEIRDEKDYPVFYSAITEDVDVFITGDRDFEGLSLDKPEIINPAGFLEKY
ncbi:twitching motility protein PilT [Desulfosporosinus sp. Tol-M]|nr:twitching motility protein PilT [Desulfosporosinus sp. Tol-M]